MSLLTCPRDILQIIASYCLNEEDTSGWTMMLACKQLFEIVDSIKFSWYDSSYALGEAALHGKYDIALAIIQSAPEFSSSESRRIMQDAAVGNHVEIIRLLLKDPSPVQYGLGKLLQTAMAYQLPSCLVVIKEHAENDAHISDDSATSYMTRTEIDEWKKARLRLLLLGQTCCDLKCMSPLTTLDTFSLFWDIASVCLCQDQQDDLITCTENRDFIYELMCFACSNGMLRIINFIFQHTTSYIFWEQYCILAFRNGHCEVLDWLYKTFKRDNCCQTWVSSKTMGAFFTLWGVLPPESVLHSSYSKCFHIVMGHPNFFRVEFVDDQVFKMIANLKHSTAADMFIRMYANNKMTSWMVSPVKDSATILVAVFASGNTEILEFLKREIQFSDYTLNYCKDKALNLY